MASIDSVAGGLVLLHGTPMEQRRLHRGDIRGLLEDAQLDLPVRRRWPHWLKAFIKAGLQPALRLRLAELADWESKEDLAHEKETTWGRWKSWARSRGWI